MRTPLLLVLCLTCLTTSGTGQELSSVAARRAREGENLREQAIRSRDGVFTARLLGQIDRTDVAGASGVYSFEFGIGSELKATCELLVNGFDLAGGLRIAADQTIQGLQSLYGRVQVRRVDRIETGAFGVRPYIALHWAFAMGDGTITRVGGLKQIAVTLGEGSLYCAHLDLGYTRTFMAAVRTLAESIEFTRAAAAPYFVEVSTARLDGEDIGVALLTMTRLADRSTRLTLSTSMVRRQDDTVEATDAQRVQIALPDGTLLSAGHLLRMDGRLETSVTLTPAGPSRWTVGGQVAGKQIDPPVLLTRRPSSLLEKAREWRALLDRRDLAGVQVRTPDWLASQPTQVVDTELTVGSRIDENRAAGRETAGGDSEEIEIERATGLPVRRVIESRGRRIEWERRLAQGAF